MVYTEFNLVEKPIIKWLERLGWKYIHPDELKRDTEEPFDLFSLRDSIKRLNPGIIASNEDVEKVVNQLRRPPNDIIGNREFFEWLRGGRSIAFKQGEKAQTIRLIDFDSPENNRFMVTNQFKFSGYENVRFDIVLMVNGLPLVVIEAKVPTRGTIDYREAIRQIVRYEREAPQLVKYLSFICVTDGVNFRYDWTTEDKFFEWKSLGATDPMEGSVQGLFQKETFLDLVGNFIVFEKERERVRKKIAMYQQVVGANNVVNRVLQGKIKTGLVWHTQGSGKTLTMLFAAWKLKNALQLANPTILLIVDRIDLENQLWGSFSNVDLPNTAKAETRKELSNKLKKESREVIITTIQKFEDIKVVLSKRENIIVFVDEAHRTQYGKLAINMRNAFPNASIFGFTGTPIDKGAVGKSTFRTFCPPGEKYLDKYSLKQSIEDGATVRLVYLPRLVDYNIPKDVLDKEFLRITDGLSEEDQERVVEESVRLKTALKSKDRIARIAKDVAEHFKTHIEPNGFKAQLVAVDREACALYKEELDKHLPSEYSVVIYTPAQNDTELLKKYHLPKDEQLKIARVTFQRAKENPRILIVTDMLLTGFDAPVEQVMYLDKPLRDHKLLQAIARTNRPYPGKDSGIIVDYVGIFRSLVDALNFEVEDIEGVAYNFDLLRQEFSKTLSALVKMFSNVKRDDTRESLFGALKVLDAEEQLKGFKANLLRLRRLYQTIAPDPFLKGFLDDYSWLLEVNEAFNKVYNRKHGDLSQYDKKTRELIVQRLLVKNIDKEIPSFVIDRDYLSNLEGTGYSEEEKIMEMKSALDYHIRINLEANPLYETLSHRLERVLKTKNRPQLLRELGEIAKEITEIEEQTRKMGVTREEFALLAVARKYLPKTSDNDLVTFVRDLLSQTKKELFSGWQKKTGNVREVNQTVFEKCYTRFSGSLDVAAISAMSEDTVKFIMKYNP
jgi:type I restriction enzyme R subunit